MAKDIFSIINIKDYNNVLETILEKKDFSEDVKNLLLSMLYKIENSYKDYEKVKVNIETRKQFVKRLLDIIEKKCNKIEIVRPLSENGEELEKQNVKYEANKETGIIKTYQNEKVILDAIIEMGQEEIYIDKKYVGYEIAIKEILRLGNQIEKAEVIRDFDGWSWNVITNEIFSKNINIIYQNMLMLLNNRLLDNWINNKAISAIEEAEIPSNEILRSKYNNNFGLTNEELIEENRIDYIKKIENVLLQKYGEQLYKDLRIQLKKAIIAIGVNLNKEQKQIILSKKNDNENKLLNMQDNKKFLEEISNKKKNINLKIKKIDTILNDETLLKEEYDKRNFKLPNKEKIFSVSHLIIILEKERNNYLEKMKSLNKIIEPKEFVKIKKQLEEEKEFYDDINIKENEKTDVFKQIEKLQEIILGCLIIDINNSETKKDIEDLIYKLRYYKQIPYKDNQIKDIEKIQEKLKKVEQKIIEKACEMKVLEKISEDKDLNYEILRNIFLTKIIDLSNIIVLLKYKKDILTVEIYDGNIHENTVEIKIKQKTELTVKLRKKIKILSH